MRDLEQLARAQVHVAHLGVFEPREHERDGRGVDDRADLRQLAGLRSSAAGHSVTSRLSAALSRSSSLTANADQLLHVVAVLPEHALGAQPVRGFDHARDEVGDRAGQQLLAEVPPARPAHVLVADDADHAARDPDRRVQHRADADRTADSSRENSAVRGSSVGIVRREAALLGERAEVARDVSRQDHGARSSGGRASARTGPRTRSACSSRPAARRLRARRSSSWTASSRHLLVRRGDVASRQRLRVDEAREQLPVAAQPLLDMLLTSGLRHRRGPR